MKRLIADLKRRFNVRGVFWRQFINWGVRQVPPFYEPLILAWWAAFLFVLWGHGRRSVRQNVAVITPRANFLVQTARAYRVFWNFASTFNDTTRFNSLRHDVDWIIDPLDTYEKLERLDDAAILLTAHMGNYDLGSYLFTQKLGRSLVIVRAAEVDPSTDEVARRHRESLEQELGKIRYVQPSEELGIDLLRALQGGETVAIQGDRVIEGVSSIAATMFGRSVQLPAGPFALALASQKPIVPIFVMRTGFHAYRVVTGEPIVVRRTSRDRQRDLDAAAATWAAALESVIRDHWYQWFTFENYFGEARDAA